MATQAEAAATTSVIVATSLAMAESWAVLVSKKLRKLLTTVVASSELYLKSIIAPLESIVLTIRSLWAIGRQRILLLLMKTFPTPIRS